MNQSPISQVQLNSRLIPFLTLLLMRFGWTQVGDRIEERFTLKNRAWAPGLWVEVRDHSTMQGYEVSVVTGVGINDTNKWWMRGICTQRGLFTLGPTELRSGDPFGLYTLRIHYPITSTIMVSPPIVPLPSIEVAAGGQKDGGRPRRRVLSCRHKWGSTRII